MAKKKPDKNSRLTDYEFPTPTGVKGDREKGTMIAWNGYNLNSNEIYDIGESKIDGYNRVLKFENGKPVEILEPLGGAEKIWVQMERAKKLQERTGHTFSGSSFIR